MRCHYQTMRFPGGWYALAFNIETWTVDYLGGPYRNRREAREHLRVFLDRDDAKVDQLMRKVIAQCVHGQT